MANLIYREQEGRELLNAEIDGNFRSLDNSKTENTVTEAIDQRLNSAESAITSQGDELADHESRLDAAEQQIGGQQVGMSDLDRRLDVVEPALEAVTNLAEGNQLALDAHQTSQDPHSQYALDSDLLAHVAAPDPHPTYLTETEADARYMQLGATSTVEVFTSSGTFTKPPGAKSIHLLLIGGGGGGASGRTGPASSQVNGGGAGSGAARVEVTFEAGIFPESCAVIVGEKGIGGAPSNDGNFRPATDGGMTSIDINGVFVTASGGFGAISSANRNGPSGLFPGGNAGSGGSTLGPGNPGNSASGAPGGGGGGGLANGSDWNGGGAERSTVYGGTELMPSGTGGIAPGGDGMDAKTDPLYSKYIYPGISGGGGASSLTSNGGDGGDGGGYGAGGGGGGAAATGFLSGAGGDGAPGVLVITTYF